MLFLLKIAKVLVGIMHLAYSTLVNNSGEKSDMSNSIMRLQKCQIFSDSEVVTNKVIHISNWKLFPNFYCIPNLLLCANAFYSASLQQFSNVNYVCTIFTSGMSELCE